MINCALLTKDNLTKRKWTRDPKYQFCHHNETINHLFFTCSVAKVVWGVIARIIGATNIPTSISQCWEWCEFWIPESSKFHMWGISAICWAIWKARNRVCFDRKLIKNPIEIICHAGALMRFWIGLYAQVDRMMHVNGVNTMLKVASDLLLPQRPLEDQCKCLKQDDSHDGEDQNHWTKCSCVNEVPEMVFCS